MNATTDPAVDRWRALDEEDRELFRTALRDFVRAYAFVSQIAPFVDADLERLYFYGKYLQPRLLDGEDPLTVDLGDSVLLTHLRTELTSEIVGQAALGEEQEPLQAFTDGTGRQHSVPEERLSALIESLNERFGLNLGDADRIWFEQQEEVLAADSDVRAAARGNDLDQFSVFIGPLMDRLIFDRHLANDELLRAYFDKPEFKEMMSAVIVGKLYEKLRAG